MAQQPQWAKVSSLSRVHDHTQRRTTVGRTPLDKWSARRRDLYLTTHNTHKRQTTMPPAGFELTIPQHNQCQQTSPHAPASYFPTLGRRQINLFIYDMIKLLLLVFLIIIINY